MKIAEQDRYGAAEKCRAVLAVWTERKRASALCRELGVSASLFSQWQDRALSGMLEALEPRGTREAAAGPALATSLKRLLDRKTRARQLQAVGRSALWRPRPAPPRSKSTPPTLPPTAAAS
jgi:transposase-like protein